MRAQLHLIFDGGASNPQSFETVFETEEARHPQGERNVADQLAAELRKEFLLGEFYDALPSTTDFHGHVSQTFSLQDISGAAYFDRRNT